MSLSNRNCSHVTVSKLPISLSLFFSPSSTTYTHYSLKVPKRWFKHSKNKEREREEWWAREEWLEYYMVGVGREYDDE